MPPKTRRAGNGPRTASQSRLSFQSKVGKPADSITSLKNAKSRLSESAKEIITAEIVRQSTPEPVEKSNQAEGKGKVPEIESPVRILPSPSRRKIRKQTAEEKAYETVEKEALKTSDAQIKKFCKSQEQGRMTSKVHQSEMHIHERILRQFDLDSEFGPCLGMTRLKRWKRAHAIGINPPVEILAVLLKEEAKGTNKGEKRAAGRLAYIDELGGARDVEVSA